MNPEDILQPIPDNKLLELKQIFKQDWPTSVHVYYFIDTCIQWKRAKPTENYVTLYSPNGDFSDGTFIAIIEMECYDVFIYTLEKDYKRLEDALRHTKRIKWTEKTLFSAVRQDYFDMVVKVRKDIGHPVSRDNPSHVWWLPREKALKYEYKIPEDLYVAPLEKSHVKTMNEVWPHKTPGSENYLSLVLELNGGIGLFKKSNNELCSWVLKNYFGGLGVLQTADNHKRKGYGTLITKIFSKILAAEDKYDVTGFIVNKNFASQGMFTRLGFEKITPVTWCEYNSL